MVASYTIEYAPIFSSLLSLVDRVAQVNPKSQAPNELHGLPFAQLNVLLYIIILVQIPTFASSPPLFFTCTQCVPR